MAERHLAVRHEVNWINFIHPGAAICAALSPSGDFYIVNSAHGQLVKRRTSDFGIEKRLNGHRMTVADVTVLSEQAAASCSADGTTRLWNLTTARQVAVIPHSVRATLVRRVSDNRGLTLLEDGSACLWDFDDGSIVWERRIAEGRPMGATVSEDDSLAYVLLESGTLVKVDLNNANTQDVRREDGQTSSTAGALALGPSKDILTYCIKIHGNVFQRVVKITGEILAEVLLGPELCRCAVWLSDQDVALGLDDGIVSVYRFAAGEFHQVRERAVHRDIVWTMDYASTSDDIVTGSSDGRVIRSSAGDLRQESVLEGLTRGVWTTAWHDDAERLLSAAGDGSVALWDLNTSERLAHSQLAGGWIRYVAWMNPTEAIAVAQKGVIYKCNSNLEPTDVFEAELLGNIWTADIHSRMERLCFGSDRGEVGILDLRSGTTTITKLRDRLISAVRWKDENTILVGTATGEGFEIRANPDGTWNVKVIQELENRDEITAIFPVYGKGLAIGYSSGAILFLGDQGDLFEIGVHEGPVQALTMTQGNLTSCGADGEIVVWDWEERRSISRHSVEVSTAGLSVSGTHVACGSAGVWVFDLQTSSETPGHESVSLSDPPLGLVDAPVRVDTIGRRGLVEELSFLCRRTSDEFERQAELGPLEERGFMIHIGGDWGAGKTSIAQMVVDDLTNGQHSNHWISGSFNAWQHEQSNPLLALLGELTKCSVAAHSRPRRIVAALRTFWIARPGLMRTIFFGLIVFIAVAFGLRFFLKLLIVAPSHGQKGGYALNADNLAALLSICGALLAVGSFLIGRGRLLLSGVGRGGLDSHVDKLTSYEQAVIRRLPRHVVLTVDEVDRCEPARVVEILRACNRLMLAQPQRPSWHRRRSKKHTYTLAFILLSEREWLYNAIETSYPAQLRSWQSRTKRLGSYFMEKLALISFDLPALSSRARAALVASATGEDTAHAKVPQLKAGTFEKSSVYITNEQLRIQPVIDVHSSAPDAYEDSSYRTREDDGLLRPVLSSTGDPKNVELVNRALEVERRMRLERKYIAQYSSLIGQNPREIKRVLVRYWLDRVVALSEGRDVEHFAEAILFESVVTVRWPNLYSAIRERKPGGLASLFSQFQGQEISDLLTIASALDVAWTAEAQQQSAHSS